MVPPLRRPALADEVGELWVQWGWRCLAPMQGWQLVPPLVLRPLRQCYDVVSTQWAMLDCAVSLDCLIFHMSLQMWFVVIVRSVVSHYSLPVSIHLTAFENKFAEVSWKVCNIRQTLDRISGWGSDSCLICCNNHRWFIWNPVIQTEAISLSRCIMDI